MKIQEIEFSRLIPADYNPRVALTPDMPEFERLKNKHRDVWERRAHRLE